MALKVLMLNASINAKRKELEALQARDAELEGRQVDLTADIQAAVTEEERKVVEAAVNSFDADFEAHESAKAALSAEISNLQAELDKLEHNDPPAPQTGAEHHNERMNTDMNTIDIRALPLTKRAFDALPFAKRQEIVARDDVKTFLAQLRSFKGAKASVSGADLLVPEILLDLIAENRFRYSKLLNRIRVRQLSGKGKQPVAGLIPPAIWVGACKRLNEIEIQFNEVTLDDYKNAAIVAVCNTDLEDSDIGLAAFIVEAISQAIGMSDDMAILYGKGAAYNMPLGIVTRLAQTSKPDSYPVNAPAWVDLHTSNIKSLSADLTGVAFWAALTVATGNTFSRYARGNQFWAMNSKTYNLLKSKAITFTASGDVVANIFGVLPIINDDIDILEFMPDGDIVGGYGDLYLWGQRRGMTIGADEYGFTNRVNDQTIFFGKERADDLPVIPQSFVAINIQGNTPASEILFPTDDANTVSGIMLNTATASVAGTATVQLEAILLPYGVEGDVTWTSATTSKATVNSSGLVTGVTAGSSVITASCNGKTASCNVTVT